MRIAFLGWGSLVWDPRQLQITGGWKSDGPNLPIEFARISGDGRLTLVIDREYGSMTQVAWIDSSLKRRSEAIADLARREGCSIRRIGFVDRAAHASETLRIALAEAVYKWADEHQLDSVVWTDLAPNFTEKTGTAFSVRTALQYVTNLQVARQKLALEYIKNAPKFVQTPVRAAVEAAFDLTTDGLRPRPLEFRS